MHDELFHQLPHVREYDLHYAYKTNHGFRKHLVVPIAVEHTCICGGKVDVYGTHGLSCRRSEGRIPRHAAICRALVSGGVPAVLEPVGVCHNLIVPESYLY